MLSPAGQPGGRQRARGQPERAGAAGERASVVCYHTESYHVGLLCRFVVCVLTDTMQSCCFACRHGWLDEPVLSYYLLPILICCPSDRAAGSAAARVPGGQRPAAGPPHPAPPAGGARLATARAVLHSRAVGTAGA